MGLTYGRRRVWVRYGDVVDSSSLFVLHFSSTSSDSHSLARTTLHRSCTLIVSSRVANSIYQSTIFGFHHFPSSLKKFNFLNLLSCIYICILLFRSHSAIRKSDFLKNRFKVVKFLKTRKVFHLFNFVALPPFPTIGWHKIKRKANIKFFSRSFSRYATTSWDIHPIGT